MTLEELISSLDDHAIDSTDPVIDRWEKIAVWQDKVNGILREMYDLFMDVVEPE